MLAIQEFDLPTSNPVDCVHCSAIESAMAFSISDYCISISLIAISIPISILIVCTGGDGLGYSIEVLVMRLRDYNHRIEKIARKMTLIWLWAHLTTSLVLMIGSYWTTMKLSRCVILSSIGILTVQLAMVLAIWMCAGLAHMVGLEDCLVEVPRFARAPVNTPARTNVQQVIQAVTPTPPPPYEARAR